ncbi:MAG: HAMP domain-containing sensor histidine kinase [Clostridia bacterium]
MIELGLLRNKELRILMLILLVIGIIGAAVSSTISTTAAIVTSGTLLVAIVSFLIFTYWRYKHLNQLNSYLKRVTGGDYSLELRDNQEGELSILKSEIYKVTTVLREQNEQLKQEKKALSNSLSDISHQLKTPLTSMFVMTDLLFDENLSEEKRSDFTDCIRSQLGRLQWLVESLLKLSKLDAKAVIFKQASVLPSQLIEKACSSLLIPIEIKNQTLSIQADEIAFYCDLNWTAEALLNILKNCMEHTPQNGEIKITVSTNSLYTQITIQDSGFGIDPVDLPYIFNRFYKGNDAGEDSVGIGLAMAKSIIESQGGNIMVKSKKENGSTFILHFPKSSSAI